MVVSIEDFCGGETFFDYDQTVNTTDPRFSSCFKELIVDLVPCYYLWLFALLYFFYVKNSKKASIKPSLLFKFKIVFTVLLWILSWAELVQGIVQWSHNASNVPPVDLVSPLVLGSSMALAAFFIQFERSKGFRSSGFLSIYWMLFLILWIIQFRSFVMLLVSGQALTSRQTLQCSIFFISYALIIGNFILSCFSDKPPEFEVLQEEEPTEDGKKKKNHPELPEEGATFWSSISFWWFTEMIVTGYKRPLVDEDLYKLSESNTSHVVVEKFLHYWNKELDKCHGVKKRAVVTSSVSHSTAEAEVLIHQNPTQQTPEVEVNSGKQPSLFNALVKTFGGYFLLGAAFKLVQDLLSFVSPQLLKLLIQFTADKSAPDWQGFMLAVSLFVIAIIQSIFLHQYFHVCMVTGMRLRSAIISAIYRKSLLLTNSARKSSTVGEVVNLMSVDAQRFLDLMTYLNIMWSGPMQIILSLYFLWNVLGPAVLAGTAVMILLIPVNGVIAAKTRALQVKQMKFKDERIKLMNEVLNGMKVLKLYAWEQSFKDKILEIRNKELAVLKRAAYLNAFGSFTWTCAPFLVSLTTFAVYVLADSSHVLNAEKAFVSLSLFNILRFPLAMLPMVISSTVQASVSLRRLEKFLKNEELDDTNVDRGHTDGPVIAVENGTFQWEEDQEDPTLHNINFSIEEGKLVAVVGQVGSGKSSLVSALLGDMDKKHGYVRVRGSIAYVPQQAWIQNATVRDNITFGKAVDPCKYQDTVKDCELVPDFDMLPGGDMTEIGEKGINLSGGQKQRVSIARAVYQDSDVYLLDDPLSAVDSHVGKNLFDNVIGPKGCLRKKTRILVTHGVAFLPQVDQIIVLVNGAVTERGDYYELLERDGAFAEFLRNYSQTEDESKVQEGDPTVLSDIYSLHEELEEDGMAVEPDLTENNVDIKKKKFLRQKSREFAAEGPHCKRVPLKKIEEKDRVCHMPKKQDQAGDKLIMKEHAETGRVKASVFIDYMRAIGFFFCFLICIFYILNNAAQVYSSIWLSEWSNDPVVNGTQTKTTLRLTVYGVLGLAQAFLVMACSFTMTIGAVLAATELHHTMLAQVLCAPMAFFDTTPLGRIMNRFSKDVYLIDEVIPRSLQGFMMTFFSTMSTFIVIIYSTPIFAAVVVPLLLLYYFIQRFYVSSSRQLKRLESVSRSPIYSLFGETVTGASTVRAYNLEKRFIDENDYKVDVNQMAYYPICVSNRWLALRLEFVGNCIVLFAGIFAVTGRSELSAGLVGLSITYALQVTQTLNWMVRQTSELETNIVSVERVKEYSNIEQEARLIIETNRPPSNWPDKGVIHFRDYSTKYRKELNLVVQGITVHIKEKEKIGIVGRTGAGKSSLTLALFRIIEAADGNIEIDGINISKIGLQDLRSMLSIIPQDPVLFSGSLRMNLDPFDKYSDAQLWEALEHAHMKPFVLSLEKKLDHEIAEGGENLSVGQRQLVCLARALLRKSKILVLDEATAAVDLETDDLIQATIRIEFEDCTTFTIAHRLNTIMDSTRVLVLDAGKVAEFDTVPALMKAKGIFYGMAKDAGLA